FNIRSWLLFVTYEALVLSTVAEEKTKQELSGVYNTRGGIAENKNVQILSGLVNEILTKTLYISRYMSRFLLLKAMLLSDLQKLKEQISGYLSGIISTIDGQISLVDDNKTEAKVVAALFVLDTLKKVDEYLKQQLPHLEEKLVDLNKKLKAANESALEALRGQLSSVLMQVKDEVENKLKKLRGMTYCMINL
ncbi:hypothetical protein T265_13204, partial [Opisthorchis viverrini]